MPDSPSFVNDFFLIQVTAIVEQNISNEQFGVSELAGEMNMSRSNLLRKVKKETGLSVSQLINQVRLKRAMEMLRKSSLNVSEVSHQVGFSSTSYFIKCFREFYGYPPGEVGKRDAAEAGSAVPIAVGSTIPIALSNRKRNFIIFGSVGLIIAIAIGGAFAFYAGSSPGSASLEKSIAVLPFKNDSNDSTNLYLINGLMESTLNNLQQIKDLKVISRTSAEKYRNSSRSIPEMAKELNVNYFVEGSGQKIGDQILLNIQLIEASSDRHLWARQYKREVKDIFALQQEIARDIVEEIQAVITPEEEKKIEKIPTDDLVAYDLFLKGKELLHYGSHDLEKAILFFKKAIERDNKFALAYADAAIAFYFLDIFKADKKYTAEIGSYADKALLYDPKHTECLMAKAMFYMHKKEYELAVPYLEKALEYNPNSAVVIGFLSDFYANSIPNTAKYLEYSLRGVRLDIGSNDSINTSYIYLRLGNALAQNGFIGESLKYVDKSLEYNPKNPYSRYVRAFLVYARDGNLSQTRELLIQEYNKDTARFDILQDIGKVSYHLRDYEGAYTYYKKFIEIRETRQLDVYKHENLTIGVVLSKVGLKEKSQEYIKSFKLYADNDRSIYKHLGLAMYHAYQNESQKAIEHLKLFSKEDNYQYWVILFCDKDPIVDSIKDLPEFKKAKQDIDARFWETHKKIKVALEEKGLL
jgi:TolB-like protein/AraC-like DNA-binding protein/Tfp pilus assembly protein PilF